jgi:hypothetical protein
LRLLLDPSILLSERGLSWLEAGGPQGEGGIVVSEAFRSAVRELPRETRSFRPWDDIGDFTARRERLIPLLDGVPVFSHRQVALPEAAEVVRYQLLEHDHGAVGEVLADEWSFLQSQSWMATRYRHVLDRFRHSGAIIVEHSKETLETLLRKVLIEEVVPKGHIPETLTPHFVTRVAAKWVVVGTSAVVLHPLLIPFGVLAGPLAGVVGERVTGRVVNAFDP